jgi:hypothetical protein
MSKRAQSRHSNKAKLEGVMMASNELGSPASKPKRAHLAEPFYLAVDRQLKTEYDTYDEAEKAAFAIKRHHPRLLVTVYEAKSGQHIVIEQPRSVAFNEKPILPKGDAVVRYPASATRH